MYILEFKVDKRQIHAEGLEELKDNVKHTLEISPEFPGNGYGRNSDWR